MAVTIVGQASAAATSVAIPTHQAGDMIIVTARGTAAAPTVPTAGGTVPAWVTLQTGLANAIGLTCCSFVATAATTTTGTWTNATHICVLVLRPGAGNQLITSAALSSVGNGNNTQTIIYPALTLGKTDGTSMGVRCGTRTVAITAVGTAPTNWTNQSIQPAGASALMSVHTRLALVANPTADTVTVTSSNAAYRAVTVEVQEATLAQSKAVGAVASAGSFGTVATGKGPVAFAASGIVSPQAFGTVTATQTIPGQTQAVTGVASAAVFGVPKTKLWKLVVGVSSAQFFGTPLIAKGAVARTVTGVPSAQAFTVISSGAPQTVQVPGVTYATVTYTAITGLVICGTGWTVGSRTVSTQFGAPKVVYTPQTVIVPGVTRPPILYSVTGQVICGDGHLVGWNNPLFGQPNIAWSQIYPLPTGIGVLSAQRFGTPTGVGGPVTIPVGGIGSAQRFGEPLAYKVWFRPPLPPEEILFPPMVCVSVLLDPVECAEEAVAASVEENLVLTPSVEG